jgi:hypothetical protein
MIALFEGAPFLRPQRCVGDPIARCAVLWLQGEMEYDAAPGASGKLWLQALSPMDPWDNEDDEHWLLATPFTMSRGL